MTARDAVFIFPFSQKPADHSEVKCLACGQWSRLSEYKDSRAQCGRCPTGHLAIDCPRCGHQHDHAYCGMLPVRL